MVDQEKIHSQCLSKNPEERVKGLSNLKVNFSSLSDKLQAWKEIIRLTTDENDYVRFTASSSLISICSQVSQVQDKQKIWNDLHELTNNEDMHVRSCIVEALVSSFSHMPDKQLVWNDLIKLTNDKEGLVRLKAIYMLESTFPYVPDKQQAWKELIKLATNEDLQVRDRAFYSLGLSFSHVPDKQQAWKDLHHLTTDEDELVRFFVPNALCRAFPNIQDKTQAWNDLIKLSCDMCTDVGYNAANALAFVFPKISEKKQAWNDLIKLTTGEDENFGLYIYHTLGKISIFNASQAETEEDYKKALEKAIEFFEKEVQVLHSGWDPNDPRFDNPSQFCLPFYRSFYTIIFEKKEAKEEIDKYLAEAKIAIKGSTNKKSLFEAVENLANALKEIQRLENLDLEAMKEKINLYRQYCDRAAELMRENEDAAHYATVTMRKGLPILDRNLKSLIEEIQKKSEIISEQTKGTQFEKLGDELNQSSQFLSYIRDPVGLEKRVNNLQSTMRSICSKLPVEQKGEACELLKMMYAEPLIEDKIPLIVNILSKFSYQLDMITHLNRIEDKLDNVRFDIFKTKLNNSNIISNLYAIKKQLEKLNEVERSECSFY